MSQRPTILRRGLLVTNLQSNTPTIANSRSEEDEEDLPTAGLDDPIWDEEPVLDNREYLCIHDIPRLATLSQHPQPALLTPPPQPHQGVPASPTQHQDKVHEE